MEGGGYYAYFTRARAQGGAERELFERQCCRPASMKISELESALFFVVLIDFVGVPKQRGVSTARCGPSERGGRRGQGGAGGGRTRW